MRSSEGVFDTSSRVAQTIKRRGFALAGLDPYTESFSDGLQVLRYNLSAAYVPHYDWISPSGEVNNNDHDYDSSNGRGTNRFLTIFLYLSEVEEGGETVFTSAPPLGTSASDQLSFIEAEAETDEYLEARNMSHL